MTGSPPRRRHSPAVYRRRRIVLLLVVIAVVAAVWLLIAQPWSSTAAPAKNPVTDPKPVSTAESEPVNDVENPPTSSEGPSAEPVATPSPSATGPGPCKASDVDVEPVTDRDSYTSKQKPKLSIALTNTGDEDCTLNVGTSTQKFVISSGGDTWWRSTDCQSKPADQVVLLAAGQTVNSSTPLEWDRTRSSVKTCSSTDRPAAAGGGASYHLSVEIGGIASEGTKQFLLY